ncbi:uncharacterized protein LOC34617853 [Cyclospora cayetanensis]|uniref:Uncharacterized protein LOC34617853 n=1 Tax=Cyclospora cayetanensis TaxID=88456 RepID=A0A6P6S1M9_9EIME|nr:uncharacterized protein LOC34617853 [Cyclospora cayetanensis]
MGLESLERLQQVEFSDIREALDLGDCFALNARQPSLHLHSRSESATSPAAFEKEPEAGAAGAKDGEQPATANMDKTSKETAEANCEKERSLGEDVKKSEVAGNASCSRPSTVLPFGVGASAKKGSEIATLHQILRMKESNLALVSDVDEQLLLNISFKQPIRLAAFSVLASTAPAGFRTDEDDGDSVSAPRLVKVYCNKNTLNFCGVVDEACAFSVLLTPEDVQKERRVTLPGSKFHMCSSAQFFLQENQAGTAYTFLNRVRFYGVVHKRYS